MKDIKYLLKRIFIGVSIGLILFLIKRNVFAADVLSHTIGQQIRTIDNTTTNFEYDVNAFANRGVGIINFTFVMQKVSGSSTSPNIIARSIYAYDDTGYYSCNFGTTSITNSTFGAISYSVSCPVNLSDNKKFTKFRVDFDTYQNNDPVQYRFSFGGLFTFKSDQDVNLDTSGTTSAINSQISNDNNNTQQIIDSQEDQTDRIVQSQEDIKDSVDEVNDTLTDDNVSSATSSGSSFFNNFQSQDHGLSGVISAPLRLIQSLSSETCSPLSFPLPFVNTNVTLPCMSSIYSTYFGSFLSIYRIITTGIIGYWVLVKLFTIVKGFQDPDSSKVEVFDL